MTAATLNLAESFRFKAGFFPCTVLQVFCNDLEELQKQLVQTIGRAPNLFKGSLVIIDLDKLDATVSLDVAKLKSMLLGYDMTPIAVRGGSDEQRQSANVIGLPIIPSAKVNVAETAQQKKIEQHKTTKVVRTPIRSGVQVYAKDGDLVVTAPVSPGAELFADGNIHVYGPLRGRALAGVQGNTQARIFCRSLEAELVSIAGYYLTKEDMQSLTKNDGMVQIFLENEQVRIEAI